MVTALKSRGNYYEILGLAPTASANEVAAAFARQMRLPHPAAELAQIGIAFDTLRSSAKRQAYDDALGLGSVPKSGSAAAMTFRVSARLAALAVPGPIAAPALDSHVLKPSLAGSVEEGEEEQVERRPSIRVRPVIDDLFDESGERLDEESTGPGKGALWLGGLLLGAVVLGAWAGAHARDFGGAGVAASRASAAPQPKLALQGRRADPDIGERGSQEPASTLPGQISKASRVGRSLPARAKVGDSGRSLSGSDPGTAALQSASDDNMPDKEASPIATSLPLSRAVIARTIDRIGYACGEVASASALEAHGAYKITCTSGQSYQAKPVGGRYRFRRL